MKPILRRWSRLLSIALLLAPSLSLSILWFRAPDRRFHPDEEYWIGSTYYFRLAFADRDFSNPDWDLLPARENHALGKYVLGLGLALQGYELRDLSLLATFYESYRQSDSRFWGDAQDIARRQAVVQRASPELQAAFARGQCPPLPQGLLRASRRVLFIFGLLSIIAWQLIASRAGYPPWVQALAALLVLHPVWQHAVLFATVDGIALAFGLWTELLFMEWLLCEDHHARKSLALAIATGLFAALACGAKLNSVIVLFSITLAAGLDILKRGPDAKKLKLKELLISTFLGAVLFILSNPTLVHDPISGTLDLWQQYSRVSELLETVFGPRLQSIPQRLQALAQLSLGSNLLFLLACAALLFESLRWPSQSPPRRAVLVWYWISLGLLLLWLPFAIDRYVLPLIPPLSLALLLPTERALGFLRPAPKSRDTSAETP